MRFELSSGPLINAGGGFLFLLAGIVILAVARRSRLGLRLGAFAGTFGLVYVLGNLVVVSDLVSAVVFTVLGLAATLFLGILIVEVMRQVSPAVRPRIAVLAIGVGLGAGIALVILAIVARRLEESLLLQVVAEFPQVFLIEPLLLVLLAAGAQPRLDGSLQQYKGRLMLGLAAGLFAVDIMMAAAAAPDPTWIGPWLDGVQILFAVLVAFTAWLVLRGRPPGAERFARRAFAAIVVVGLIGCLQAIFSDQADAIGSFGIIRSVGAVLLVLAVVKYDLLGVPLPRIVVRRGALAGGALAVLFVVAQVAQNFFSAKYGLLMGGILAGGFVFAASPIQKAIERMAERKERPVGTGQENEGAYRSAVELALHDRLLLPVEELALADLAERLGIGARRATEIRLDAQGKRSKPGKGRVP